MLKNNNDKIRSSIILNAGYKLGHGNNSQRIIKQVQGIVHTIFQHIYVMEYIK